MAEKKSAKWEISSFAFAITMLCLFSKHCEQCQQNWSSGVRFLVATTGTYLRVSWFRDSKHVFSPRGVIEKKKNLSELQFITFSMQMQKHDLRQKIHGVCWATNVRSFNG